MFSSPRPLKQICSRGPWSVGRTKRGSAARLGFWRQQEEPAPEVRKTSGRTNCAPYSFLRLETEQGMTWVAVPMAEVPKKSKVTVKNATTLKGFESRQAGRKFETVVFGVLEKG